MEGWTNKNIYIDLKKEWGRKVGLHFREDGFDGWIKFKGLKEEIQMDTHTHTDASKRESERQKLAIEKDKSRVGPLGGLLMFKQSLAPLIFSQLCIYHCVCVCV